MGEMERADRLRQARKSAGLDRATDAIERFGWNTNTYKSNENGSAPFSFKKAKEYALAYGVRPEWLYDGAGMMRGDQCAVLGEVGADAEGARIQTEAQNAGDRAPMPPGGTSESVAVEVRGDSMRGYADDGSLVYFELQQTPPTEAMIGSVAVMETEDGRVLLKRIQRGRDRDHYDLESIVGEPIRNVRLRWAALPTAIIPPDHARKIILRRGE